MSRGTIAVDLDDVLASTNAKVAEIHNEMFGTDMSLDDFDYCEHGWVACFVLHRVELL